jgi:NUMOD4 motif/HNH endonuclease
MGNVKSAKSGRPLKQNKRHSRRYIFIVVYVGKECGKKLRKKLLPHQLVANLFVEKPEGKEFINHKNGILTDNRAENLEWVDPIQNLIDKDPDEEWVDVTDYEGQYMISNKGNLYSVIRNKFLDGQVNKAGYKRIGIRDFSGKRNYLSIHRLVGFAFIPLVEGKNEINHIDGIKTNNTVENLEWVTGSENCKHAFDTGLRLPTYGKANGMSKLTNEQVLNIREERKNGTTYAWLSLKYGVNRRTISKIVKRLSWKHIII